MIPKECKRLAEVDFPIAVVSKHAVREKTIRHGHPSTLHLWWARRPLAACRAMLMALLLPDPVDTNCPEDFKKGARALLPQAQGKVGPTNEDLRAQLFRFIGDFSNWTLSSNETYLEVARGLLKAAHPEEIPLVVDPFAGGGSIPLEALRLGCDVYSSDLNPVACLIQKVLLEDIPRSGPILVDKLRSAETEISAGAEKALSDFYPADPDGARPIAYLWARTVRCESPRCGAEIPLVRSFWLCKKANRRRALKHAVARPRGQPPVVTFEIFEPKKDADVPPRTVTRAKATCVACSVVLPPDRVRAQLRSQHGGGDVIFDKRGDRKGGACMLAVVTLKKGSSGRQYRLASDRDYQAVARAAEQLQQLIKRKVVGGLPMIPNEPTPVGGGKGAGRAFSVQQYGMLSFGDLFTTRQKLALSTFASQIRKAAPPRTAALALGKLADLSNAMCPWEPIAERPRNVLSNGRIKPSWDFAEGVPISDSSGGFSVCVENLIGGVESVRGLTKVAQCDVAAAQKSRLPSSSAQVWFTDPPYYDALPYADLSDMFFVWLHRALPEEAFLRDPFDPGNPLTPKTDETVQDESRSVDGLPKDRRFFENSMAGAFAEGRRILRDDGIGAVVFAHKTTEGWEALLSGMTRSGWSITASWPVATEQAHRLRARDSAALATSVHLVCRPRPDDSGVGDWGEVLRELPPRVTEWMTRLQQEGVRGADLVFACIGPALEIFSRFEKVETAEGREVSLAEYLEKVWEVVGRSALEEVLSTGGKRTDAASALEEDARLTALFLWTLQSTESDDPSARQEDQESDEDSGEDEEDDTPSGKKKGLTLLYDVVRRFAQPLGIHLEGWEKRIIETNKGVVRLLPVAERAEALFGEDGAAGVARTLEREPAAASQLRLFPDAEDAAPPKAKGGRRRGAAGGGADVADDSLRTRQEATTLDRVHAAMLLQRSGKANALRALLTAEVERGPAFLRLANGLTALYPRDSEEKRLLDAMLLAVPRN